MIARAGKKVWKQYRTPPEMKFATGKYNIVKYRCGQHLGRRVTAWAAFDGYPLYDGRPCAKTKAILLQHWAKDADDYITEWRNKAWQN